MRLKVFMIVPLGMIALLGTGCSVQREAVRSEVRSQTTEVVRDTVREQVVVAVLDSVTITKTITITENEQGDTVRLVEVTDRDRVRDRAAVCDKEEKVMVKTDTVYVERRDSVFVQAPAAASATGKNRPAWVQGLKWVFWIVIAVTVLVVIFKVSKILRV